MSNVCKADAAEDETFKVVAFEVAGQQYCLDIMLVREIRGWTQTTPLPHAQDFLRGVVNLRGAVLPVVDLSERLGFGACTPTARHGVIIVDLPGEESIGLLVDGVADILEFRSSEVQPTPSAGGGATAEFVQGVVATPDGLIAQLKVDAMAPVDMPCRA